MTKEFYTEKELAERWCLKVVTLQTWRQKGLPPLFKKFGEAVRYSTIDIEQFDRDSVFNSTHKYN
jgi:hypothetical protein